MKDFFRWSFRLAKGWFESNSPPCEATECLARYFVLFLSLLTFIRWRYFSDLLIHSSGFDEKQAHERLRAMRLQVGRI